MRKHNLSIVSEGEHRSGQIVASRAGFLVGDRQLRPIPARVTSGHPQERRSA